MGPTDPISGGATAIIGTFSQASMGFVDMPVETLKLFQKSDESKARAEAKAKAKANASRKEDTAKAGSARSGSASVLDKPELTTMSSSTSSNYMNLGGSSLAAETSTIASSESAASTQFEPSISPSLASGISTPVQSPPMSPQIKAPSGPGSPRGRPSSMADAMAALTDTSASPIRNQRTSRSPTPSIEGGSRRASVTSRSRSGSASTAFKHNPLEGSGPYTLNTLYGTSKGVSRIVGAGLRSPLDFTMAISKGFHNLPRLYGEEPRQVDRVTDMASGVRVAGKEFGRGMFDGITGLVTQPISGAKKEGAAGFIKGFGRGIAGVVAKPAAAVYALPAYGMMGVYKSIQNHLGESTASYILSGRIAQGFAEWSESPESEQAVAVGKWSTILDDIKLRKPLGPQRVKENTKKTKGKDRPISPSRHSSFAMSDKDAYLKSVMSFVDKQKEKRRLKQTNEAPPHPTLGRDNIAPRPQLPEAPSTSDYNRDSTASSSQRPIPKQKTNLAYESDDDEQELEEALRLSLMSDQTVAGASSSHLTVGHHDDDADLTRAITNSLNEMRRADEDHEEELFQAKYASKAQVLEEDRDAMRMAEVRHQEDLAKALEESKQFAEWHVSSTTTQRPGPTSSDYPAEKTQRGAEKQSIAPPAYEEDEDVRRAMAESLKLEDPGSEDIQKALEESKRIQDEEERKRKEEEIVLKYIKKQSLAEAEYKSSKS